jgi:hypothetical protein
MAGAPPSAAAPASEIVSYLDGHHAGVAAGLWLFGLATIPLLWWFGGLWARMVRAEGGQGRLAVVSLAGLMIGGTLALVSAIVLVALVLIDGAVDVVSLYTLAAVSLSAAGFGLCAHLVSTNALAIGGAMYPTWLAYLGFVAAIAFLGSAVLGAFSNDSTSNTVSLVGFALWLIWILGISSWMWRDDTGAEATPLGHSPTMSV